jgi:small-conductance mechanosensitive channel
MREIKERFDSEGIEIAFPHLTVYAGSDSPPFPVKVSSESSPPFPVKVNSETS